MQTIAQRVEWAMTERGLNKNQLEVSARLSPGYLSTMFERGSDNTRAGTLTRIANALGTTPAWLATGAGEPFQGPAADSPAPPPISDVHTTNAAADQLIAAAFNPTCHEYLDTVPVREALGIGAPLMHDLDPTEYVRHLLDTAARHRRKGQAVTGKDLHGTAIRDAFEETRALRQQLAERDAIIREAHEFMRANGIDPDKVTRKSVAASTSQAPKGKRAK
jgi:hypothetical protein